MRKHKLPRGLTRDYTRHGAPFYKFRLKNKPSGNIHAPLGSREFEEKYHALMNGEPISNSVRQHTHGTIDWLIEQYKRSSAWSKVSDTRRYTLSRQFDRFSKEHGKRRVTDMKRKHVEALIAKKHATPSAANELLKLIRLLCNHAIRLEIIPTNPAKGVEKFNENPDGFHTWTEEEIARFEDFHGIESTAVVALRLIINSGARRINVPKLGWQNIKNDRISFKSAKGGADIDLPLLSATQKALSFLPRDRMLFVTHGYGKPYTTESFGNWFSSKCVECGVPGRAHGLRKAGATRLANEGATEYEIMTYLGHKSPDEARTYTAKFNRQKTGDSAMKKLENASTHVIRLDKTASKPLKRREK